MLFGRALRKSLDYQALAWLGAAAASVSDPAQRDRRYLISRKYFAERTRDIASPAQGPKEFVDVDDRTDIDKTARTGNGICIKSYLEFGVASPIQSLNQPDSIKRLKKIARPVGTAIVPNQETIDTKRAMISDPFQ
jgi:hypothetical protein